MPTKQENQKLRSTRGEADNGSLQLDLAPGLDRDELISVVCNEFCRANRVGTIKKVVKDRYGIELTREQPYDIVRWAAANGRLQYIAPIESDLSLRLIEEHPWLRRVRTVHTTDASDVAFHAANVLLDIVRKWEKPELHVGFAGGGLMMETVKLLTNLLKTPGISVPKKIVVHALVAAAYNPACSPNSFLQWFLDPDLPFETDFVGLPAPGFATLRTLRVLRQLEGVREAFDSAREIDLLVTSAGAHWEKGCSALYESYKSLAGPDVLRSLGEAGAIGDVLWQPFGVAGAVELEAGIRAVTLLGLSELPKLIADGRQLVLVVAPCGNCHQPKTDVLRAVLGLPSGSQFITHLVADSRAVLGLFR